MQITTLKYGYKNRGFILITTMFILILLMIIGMSIYQQVTLSTKTMGTNRFKAQAQNTSINALNDIERTIIIPGTSSLLPATPCATPCSPPTVAELTSLITFINGEGGSIETFTEYSSNAATGTTVYSLIENLGKFESSSQNTFYRTTIVTSVMGTIDVIESIYLAIDKP